MGDLSKKFSHYEVQCSCGYGASWVSPKLLEKLQHVRDVVGKPMTITNGVANHLTKALTAVWFRVTCLMQMGWDLPWI